MNDISIGGSPSSVPIYSPFISFAIVAFLFSSNEYTWNFVFGNICFVFPSIFVTSNIGGFSTENANIGFVVFASLTSLSG